LKNQLTNGDNSREHISERFKWNLGDLYNSIDQWRSKKGKLSEEFKKLSSVRNKFTSSAQNLYEGLSLYSKIDKEFMRLYAYASMLSDQNTQEASPMSMKQEMIPLQTQFKSVSSFIEPEILSLSHAKLDEFYNKVPKLKLYRQFISDILRRKTHTLAESEEELIAQAGLMAGTSHEIFNVFSNADLPYPLIELSDGQKIQLDPTNYSLYRENKNREDRKKVFFSFFETLEKFQRTFGTQLYGELKKNLFYKNVRNYNSAIEASLDTNNIPTKVYTKLIENVNRNLSTLHRYLKLRAKLLNIPNLQFYDAYTSITKNVDFNYQYDEAKTIIHESLKILGDEYGRALNRAFKNRWIDVYPNKGKKSGAYMDGIAYDAHPYILLNFKGRYNDVSTLTHELGHAMHSYFSNKTQSYINSQYPIFLAEVASTVNEALLMEYMLKHIEDKEERLALLGNALDGFRGTLFRQTQFAEYELKINELVQEGEALTGEKFTEVYLDIFRKYYGHNKNIMNVEEIFGVEWAYIPHFYYNFYVYQYATSFTASQTIAAKFIDKEPGIVDRYLNFLSSGCSKYAIPTLQNIGIDMTGDEPFNITIKRMNYIMDEIEALTLENQSN
jgi:oligoendopeptidase F